MALSKREWPLKSCANPSCKKDHQERGWFCSPECRRSFNQRKRAMRAGKKCRLCGRVFPRPKVKREQETPVLSEHNTTQESSPCPM
jgi:hypothetical protein